MTLNAASLFEAAMGQQHLSAEEWLAAMRFPLDHDSRVWRYIKIRHFVDLLQRREVYLPRLDRLVDKFEGAFSDDAFEESARELAALARQRGIEHPAGVNDEDAALLTMTNSESDMRASVFVNCWHWNEYESHAMWKLFARDEQANNGGVAIRSTKGRLWESITPDQSKPVALLGDVAYYDRRIERMPCPLQWLCKDQMFSWEREVRIWMPKNPREYSIMGFNEDHPDHLYLPTDLNILIEEVVLPPASSDEYAGQIRQLLDEFGLAHVPLRQSAADEEPYYRPYLEQNRNVIRQRGINVPVHRNEPEPAERSEQDTQP